MPERVLYGQSSAGWIPAKIVKLSIVVRRSHPVHNNAHGVIKNIVNEASASTETPDQYAVYSYMKYTKDRAAICNVFSSAPHPDPISRLNCATRDFRFLRNVL